MLEYIPQADCVREVDLDSRELPVVKTVGVLWSASEVEFTCTCQLHQPSRDHSSTKRAFLKKIASFIFFF